MLGKKEDRVREEKNVVKWWVWKEEKFSSNRKRLCGGGLGRYVLIGFSASGGGLGEFPRTSGLAHFSDFTGVNGKTRGHITRVSLVSSPVLSFQHTINPHFTLMRFLSPSAQCGATAFPASRLPPA
jgi:hypothetical protein